jgi:hypothetical protein
MLAWRAAGDDAGELRDCARGLVGARIVCWFAVMLAGLVFVGGAWGATGHVFVSSVSEAPPGTGLVGPGPMAVDGASGQVFVCDPLAGYVDVFDGEGVFVTRFGGGLLEGVGVAVDESSGDVYVADAFAEGIDVYRPDGSGGYVLASRWWGSRAPGGEFGEVAGVSVDNSGGPSSGYVYVLEARTAGGGPAAIDVYGPAPSTPEGEEGREGPFLGRLSGGKLEHPNGISVDSGSGLVLVADSFLGAILTYSAEGGYEGKLTGKGSPYGSFKSHEELGNVAGVGVDGSSGDIYVAEVERHVVSQYAHVGEEWKWQGWITTTPSGDLSEPRGVATSGSGDVYVTDAGLGVVDRFGPGVVVPSVTTEKVTKAEGGLTRTGAVLLGTVNGEGEPSSYHFQYGATEALGSETLSQESGTGVQTVKASVEGLEAGHVYYYRVVGENENGSSYGLTERFETLPAVEALSTGPVTSVTPESVVLTGSLKRGGLVTHYYFQYGTTSAYGNQAPDPAGEVPAAAEEKDEKQPKTLTTPVSGLAANTLYHYRLVAQNNTYGATYGEDKTFTTLGPPAITIEPASGRSQTGVTLNAKINPESSETTYRFQYGQTEAYGQETTPGSAGSGSTPQAVSATLTGLNVGTTYHYRVIAENGHGTTTSTDEEATTVPSAPVDAMWASDISSSEAVVHTMINPLGNDTHYYFQYGPQPCQPDPEACANVPLAPGNDLGESEQDTPGEEQLTGLEPDTTYHYRVLANNNLGTTEGPERTFTTQAKPSPIALPDNRAWEMVTPPSKGSAPVEALTREGGVILASENGNTFTYVVNGALGEEVEGNRSPEKQQVLATRTSNGWESHDIATPSDKAQGIGPGNPPEYQFFSPDLTLSLVQPVGARAEPPLAEGVTQNTMYLRDNATRTYLPVVSEANTAPGTHFGGAIHFFSATPDLSHVLFSSELPLTGPGTSNGLYEWSGGKLQFVSKLPGEKRARAPELGFYNAVLTHAVTTDGSRVFWTNKEDLNTRGGHLYLRDTVRGETIRLDAAQGMREPEQGSAEFQGASSDGSRVFFIDRQRLTADSTAEPGQGAGEPDLYECQIVEVGGRLACDLHDLTIGEDNGQHANVQGLVLGINEDGSRVFLVAQGVLASNWNGNGEQATAGKSNLYELNYDGAKWSRAFIATLSNGDNPEWEGNQNANTAYLTARVSPNGKFFAFMSQAPITGYDNVDAQPAANGARDEEVFLYDAATASLRCVSCNPSGGRPEGVLDTEKAGEGLGLLVDRRLVWGREGHEHWLAGNIPGWTAQSLIGALYQSRYLTNQGRLYFNSSDDLVPAASNHREDVYEYEPSGVGGCQSVTGGCVASLSGGSSDHESAFLEATPNGGSVFFLTEAQLLPQDTDTTFDIYVARECAETSPCLTPPQEKDEPCAETETCRPAQPAQPVVGGPYATTVPLPPGNVVRGPTSPAKHAVEARKAKKPFTRSQKLKRALKRCRMHRAHSKRKRKACKQAARKRYGHHRKPRNNNRNAHRNAKSTARHGERSRR